MTLSERLREHFATECAADPAVDALVTEACRIVDRLEQIDAIVAGKAQWIELMHFRLRNGGEQRVEVTLDGVLSEARQQANALRGIIAQLGAGKAGAVKKETPVGDPIDEIAARRAQRGGATARPRRAARGAR